MGNRNRITAQLIHEIHEECFEGADWRVSAAGAENWPGDGNKEKHRTGKSGHEEDSRVATTCRARMGHFGGMLQKHAELVAATINHAEAVERYQSAKRRNPVGWRLTREGQRLRDAVVSAEAERLAASGMDR